MIHTKSLLTVALTAAALILPGCLDREEEITIAADGSLQVRHEISGDRGDVDGGAARLPHERAFEIRRFDRPTDDGKEEHVLEASARYARAEDVPTTFAPADDPLKEAALHFTTRVHTERVGDVTHLTFVRRYGARTHARYAYLERLAIPDAVRKLVDDKKLETMTAAERRTVLEAFRGYERLKSREWVTIALERCGVPESRRLHATLAAHAAIDAHFRARLPIARLEEMLALGSRELELAAERALAEIDTIALNAIVATLGDASPPRERLAHEVALAREDFEVTEDLKDENFRVRVTFPGRVESHNGTPDGERTVSWRFGGRDLNDRDHVLVARVVVGE